MSCMRKPAEELTNIIFVIVGNLNQGIGQLRTRDQFHEVAKLNLKAGKTAIASSSFDSAAKYLLVGISLLNDDSWNNEYELSLGLYDAGECNLEQLMFLILCISSDCLCYSSYFQFVKPFL